MIIRLSNCRGVTRSSLNRRSSPGEGGSPAGGTSLRPADASIRPASRINGHDKRSSMPLNRSYASGRTHCIPQDRMKVKSTRRYHSKRYGIYQNIYLFSKHICECDVQYRYERDVDGADIAGRVGAQGSLPHRTSHRLEQSRNDTAAAPSPPISPRDFSVVAPFRLSRRYSQ